MLGTFHDDTIVVVVDKLEGSHEVAVESHIELRWRSRTYIRYPILHRAWCPADGPSPQKGRQCSPSSVWAALRATLAFPICGFEPFVS